MKNLMNLKLFVMVINVCFFFHSSSVTSVVPPAEDLAFIEEKYPDTDYFKGIEAGMKLEYHLKLKLFLTFHINVYENFQKMNFLSPLLF